MREGAYQKHIIDRLKATFPGCLVLKNDSGYLQGIPDLLFLWGEHWAMLEVKIDEYAPAQPNQHYYVTKCDDMSFAAFIYPQNEEVVFDEIREAFGSRR